MTISSTTNQVSFSANGVTTSFSFPFYFLADVDLVVIETVIATGVQTVKTLTTHYTVSGAGVQAGGTVTMLTAPASTVTLTIYRDPALTQGADLVENDPLPVEEAIEKPLDRLTMIAQRLRSIVTRALRQPDGDVADVNTLPAKVTRASKYLAFDTNGDPVATSGTTSPFVVSTFMEMVLDDTTAPAARVTLGFPAIAAKGDLIAGSAVDTLTKLPVGADGEILLPAAGATSGLAWLRSPFGGALIINGKIARSVAGSALTVALKTLADADPSTSSPVYVLVPTVTSNVFDGGYVIRKVTAALSMAVSSGSTLGHASTVASPVYVYLLDNAGTLEFAVSNKFFDGVSVQSTTAEGGAGGADSGTTLYSTTARSNVAVVCLQRWKSTQTTAGTWAATTGEVQLYPFPHKKPTVQKIDTPGANTYTKPWDMLWATATVVGAGGGSGGCPTTGAGQFAAAAGGGAGGTSIKTLAADSIGPTETATVGTAGTAGAAGANTGGTGGTSSFGAHASATGGAGGGGGVATSGAGPQQGAGGASGTGSSGDVNISGGGAGLGVGYTGSSAGGFGGSSFMGGGGKQFSAGTATAGEAGQAYGSGASGSAISASTADQAGSAGKVGVILVEESYT